MISKHGNNPPSLVITLKVVFIPCFICGLYTAQYNWCVWIPFFTNVSPGSVPFHTFSTTTDMVHKTADIGNLPVCVLSLERQESVATTEARLRMEGVELKEEWQDEDFPRYCCEIFSQCWTSCFWSHREKVLLTLQSLCVCTPGLCLRKRNLKTSCLQEPPKQKLVMKPSKKKKITWLS